MRHRAVLLLLEDLLHGQAVQRALVAGLTAAARVEAGVLQHHGHALPVQGFAADDSAVEAAPVGVYVV